MLFYHAQQNIFENKVRTIFQKKKQTGNLG